MGSKCIMYLLGCMYLLLLFSPPHSETHFKLFIVSSAFQNHTLISRHRMIHTILHSELDKAHGGPIHALSMICKTPQQWETVLRQQQQEQQPEQERTTSNSILGHQDSMVQRVMMGSSPKCQGGDGSLPKRNHKV